MSLFHPPPVCGGGLHFCNQRYIFMNILWRGTRTLLYHCTVPTFLCSLNIVNHWDMFKGKQWGPALIIKWLGPKVTSLRSRKPLLVLFVWGPPNLSAYGINFSRNQLLLLGLRESEQGPSEKLRQEPLALEGWAAGLFAEGVAARGYASHQSNWLEGLGRDWSM